MPDAVISVEKMGKRYRLGQTTSRRETRDARTELWALKDVTFDVQRGEVLGIIGRNGAGKSTLLKILSRITDPSEGRAVLRGRVNSLLEVGTGFHPELTGRENIFMNAALHGMRRLEIMRQLDEIVAFAEVERFIDTPVKRYSSGMYMRLAFAVAAYLDPEILIVDEVLAVGDVRFQRKCMDKMDEVGSQGRTVLFVSHNMAAITRLCKRTVLLEGGKLVSAGPTHSVVGDYFRDGNRAMGCRVWPELESAPGDDVVRLRRIQVIASNGRDLEIVPSDQEFLIRLEYDVLQHDVVLVPGIRFVNQDGIIIFQSNAWDPSAKTKGRHRDVLHIPANLLAEGLYYLSVGFSTPSPTIKRLFEKDVVAFQVADDNDRADGRNLWGGDLPGIIRPLLQWDQGVESP